MDKYVEETIDVLDSLDESISKWGENIQDRTLLADMQRNLHTLKGDARSIDQMAICDLSHAMESVYEALKNDKIELNDNVYALANKVQSKLGEMIESLRKKEDVISDPELIESLNSVLETDDVVDDEFNF